jgi:hypothetical protein
LSEGGLYDCCELFQDSGNWSLIHSDQGLSCHDGFDIGGRCLQFSDLSSAKTCQQVLALVLRRVVRDWHARVPGLSFGILRRPQIRSKAKPNGFNPNEPRTAYHNLLARRTGLILTLAMMLGQFVSIEQPGSSRVYLLHCFPARVRLGCVISHFTFCSYGSAFHKASKWLHNKPWLVGLECECQCPYKGKHLVAKGHFTEISCQEFKQRCRPSCFAVYGREPKPGDHMSSFSTTYPLRLVHQMAAGHIAAKLHGASKMPIQAQLRSLQEVGSLDCEPSIFPCTDPLFPDRLWHEDPEWISDLSESLAFKELFRFQFQVPGHINVNESQTYKSWIKSMAKSEPNTRFCGLLDSRVTMVAASKGRSSSPAIIVECFREPWLIL